MTDVRIDIPCSAYNGDEPFAFISYAHADASLVYPEILRISLLGCRVWFDEGIDPGNEWPDEIASALQRSTVFFVFITPQSVQSKNVRNEINLAIKLGKTVVAIHMEDTALPGGLDLQMSSTQAVMKWTMGEQGYIRKLKKVLPAITMSPSHDMAEVVAQTFYEAERNSEPPSGVGRQNWQELPDSWRERYRLQSKHLVAMMTVSGFEILSARDGDTQMSFHEDDIDLLARMEHDLWSRDKFSQAWTHGFEKSGLKKEHPCLVPWRDMAERERECDRRIIREMPGILMTAGYTVVSIYDRDPCFHERRTLDRPAGPLE